MKILSVNSGLPRQIGYDGGSISTGIYKSPVHRRVRVGKVNIEGDGQADLSVHGSPNKAVYAYPFRQGRDAEALPGKPVAGYRPASR